MRCASRNNFIKGLEVVPKLGWEVESGRGRKVPPGGESHQKQDSEMADHRVAERGK